MKGEIGKSKRYDLENVLESEVGRGEKEIEIERLQGREIGEELDTRSREC
jgi:hypothetical protein